MRNNGFLTHQPVQNPQQHVKFIYLLKIKRLKKKDGGAGGRDTGRQGENGERGVERKERQEKEGEQRRREQSTKLSCLTNLGVEHGGVWELLQQINPKFQFLFHSSDNSSSQVRDLHFLFIPSGPFFFQFTSHMTYCLTSSGLGSNVATVLCTKVTPLPLLIPSLFFTTVLTGKHTEYFTLFVFMYCFSSLS